MKEKCVNEEIFCYDIDINIFKYSKLHVFIIKKTTSSRYKYEMSISNTWIQNSNVKICNFYLLIPYIC